MFALSTRSWKGDIWVKSHLDFERWRERKKSGRDLCSFPAIYYHSFNANVFLCCNWSRNLDTGKACVLGVSRSGNLLLPVQGACSFGASVASACTLEHKICGNVITDGSDSDVCFSEKLEHDKLQIDEEMEITGRDSNEVDAKLDKKKNGKIDVRALAQSLQFAKKADDIEIVLKNFDDLPLPVYSSMISGFGRDKRFDPAMALVEWLKRKGNGMDVQTGPNLFIYNSLLAAARQCGEFGVVDRLIADMSELGIIPNVVTYNTLMAIYIDQDRPSEALNIMSGIKCKGISPSHVTFSIALLAYGKLNDANGALKFFSETKKKFEMGDVMKDAGQDLEQEYAKFESFTIRVCCQVMRRWLVKCDSFVGDIFRLLRDMDKAELRPSRTDYERLVWACTRESHYVVAKEFYTRMRESGDEISLSVCNHVIWLMGKAKKWWAALEIYEHLLDKGPKPNNLSYELIVSHFNLLISAARRKGIWRWGVRLINKMQEKGLKPGTREWNAVLVACSKASETTAAVQIFKRMVEEGEKPTILSYGALLSALEKGKMYEKALEVWKHMSKVGVKPNSYAFTILISIYIGQGRYEEVDSVIHEMASLGIEPTVVTYNAIVSGCADNGMGSAALEWFNRMKVSNIKPNQITYEMLILALARDAKPRLAYELYMRASNEGLHLSSRAYNAIKLSSEIQNASIDLSTLGPRPQEKRRVVKIRKVLSDFCRLADVPRRSKPFSSNELYIPPIQDQ